MKAYRGVGGMDPLFLTLGIGWRVVVSVTPQLLYPREGTLVPTVQEAGWVPDWVWTFWRKELSLATAGIRTPARKPLANLYTDYANIQTCFDIHVTVHRAS